MQRARVKFIEKTNIWIWMDPKKVHLFNLWDEKSFNWTLEDTPHWSLDFLPNHFWRDTIWLNSKTYNLISFEIYCWVSRNNSSNDFSFNSTKTVASGPVAPVQFWNSQMLALLTMLRCEILTSAVHYIFVAFRIICFISKLKCKSGLRCFCI